MRYRLRLVETVDTPAGRCCRALIDGDDPDGRPVATIHLYAMRNGGGYLLEVEAEEASGDHMACAPPLTGDEMATVLRAMVDFVEGGSD